jgi:hypothetical protein
MDLSTIFNSVGSGVQKVGQSLSGLFGPTHIVNAATPPPAPAQYQVKNRGVQISDADLNAARPLIYGEVSNRPPEKQALEANVIMNTAINRMKEYAAHGSPKTLAQVLAMPKQYQAYGGPQYQAYSNSTNVLDQAKKKQIDTIMDGISNQIKSGNYADTTQGAYYYKHNPDQSITYDNTIPLYAKPK